MNINVMSGVLLLCSKISCQKRLKHQKPKFPKCGSYEYFISYKALHIVIPKFVIINYPSYFVTKQYVQVKKK